jgi:hypothetical protein
MINHKWLSLYQFMITSKPYFVLAAIEVQLASLNGINQLMGSNLSKQIKQVLAVETNQD